MILQVVLKVFTTFSNAEIFWKIFFPAFKIKISIFCWKCQYVDIFWVKKSWSCKVLRMPSNLVPKGQISCRIHFWHFKVDWAILSRHTHSHDTSHTHTQTHTHTQRQKHTHFHACLLYHLARNDNNAGDSQAPTTKTAEKLTSCYHVLI